jgi:hypothetical protein
MLALDGGDFLIANLFGSNVLRYNASDGSVVPLAAVEHPIGPGETFPDPTFPSNGPNDLAIVGDDLLVLITGPDHNHTGQLQRYNLATGAFVETLIDGLGSPTAFAFIAPVPEPSTLVLAGCAAAGLAFALASKAHRRRRKQQSPTAHDV